MTETAAAARTTIRPMDQAGDLGWVVMANSELYAHEYGWDGTFETLALGIVADFATARDQAPDDPRGPVGWVAESDGARVGCVMVVPGDDPGVAKLRLLAVDRRARGQRLGARLVATAVEWARDAGYERMRLWTNHPLHAARKIYLAQGFALVGEEPHHSFGAELIGQTYDLAL